MAAESFPRCYFSFCQKLSECSQILSLRPIYVPCARRTAKVNSSQRVTDSGRNDEGHESLALPWIVGLFPELSNEKMRSFETVRLVLDSLLDG